MIIEVEITEEIIEQAKGKAISLGKLNNSITKGEGNLVGFIGEALFANYFGGELSNTYNYDVIINDKKVDVKTKKTTVRPQSYYLCTVADYNTKQRCDEYYFVRVTKDLKTGYLLGGLPKDTFYKKAEFCKRGEIDPTSAQGWTFKADCYNVPISELIQRE